MKVCVYGAGAIGSFLAGRLFKGGADVSVIARGKNLEAIRRTGIHVTTPGYQIAAPVRATDDPSEIGHQDFVVVAVKSPSLTEIVDGLKPLIGPDTTVAFVMNGIPWWYFHAHGGPQDGSRLDKLDPGGRLWDAVDPARVIGGVIYCACDLVAPGDVHCETPQQSLLLGEPDGTNSDRLGRLAALLHGDTFTVKTTNSIRTAIWSKLQTNMCTGLLGCLGEAPPGDIYHDPACADALRRIVAECGSIARSMGYPTEVDAEDLIKRGLKQTHLPSIVQDLEKGRPMEIDSMFGIPLDMGRTAGVESPTIDLLVALTTIRARRAGSYF